MTALPPVDPDNDQPTLPLQARRSDAALRDGARIAEFEVRGVIGEGGFGIVYLAWDHVLRRRVALKEYLPATLASRSGGAQVVPHLGRAGETFVLGLRSFINEAQLLARFDHPSLLKVYRFWEDHGTAYMVMPYYRGVTLKRALATLDAPPEEAWLARQLGQLLDALAVMHAAHCFHRDIAPDNILLLDEGRPLLLDFGAARHVIGDSTQALTAFLKPGYAPVEQYAEMPAMKQGAWTDLYALGAVAHYAITGRTPPESVARLVADSYVPLARVAAGRYSARFLKAIDHALALRPEDRPQSAAQLRDELGLQAPSAPARASREIPTTPMPLDGGAAPGRRARGTSPTGADDGDRTLPPGPAPSPPAVATPPRARRAPALPVVPGSRAMTAVLVGTLGAAAALTLLWFFAGTGPARPPAAATSAPPGAIAPTDAVPPVAAPQGATPQVAAPAGATPGGLVSPGADSARTADDATPADAARADAPATSEAAASSSPAVPVPPPVAPPGTDRGTEKATRASPGPSPRSKLIDPRCSEIIARVSLGESLSPDERALLQKECRR